MAACGRSERASSSGGDSGHTSSAPASAPAASAPPPVVSPSSNAEALGRVPNELGRIPILEYHLIGAKEGRWEVEHQNFRRNLQMLYDRGYRPVSVSELIDKKLDLPAGLSPVVFTFDDASPGQFRYIERGDSLVIDSTSAVGIWLDFRRTHPDWSNRAVFCMLPAAEEGRSFFGNKGIEGQKTEWRHRKLKVLADSGFELCNHTLWHAQLIKYSDEFVMEHLARVQMAVDSAVPGYKLRTLALPLGLWPKNRALAAQGSWRDPKSGRTITYKHDAVLLVSGGPARSPHDPQFDPLRLTRVQVFGDALEETLDWLDAHGRRYVSDGDATVVARPPATVAQDRR